MVYTLPIGVVHDACAPGHEPLGHLLRDVRIGNVDAADVERRFAFLGAGHEVDARDLVAGGREGVSDGAAERAEAAGDDNDAASHATFFSSRSADLFAATGVSDTGIAPIRGMPLTLS